MINWIKRLYHPEAYHGINSGTPFFEGRYHKIVTKSGHPFAIIPGIYCSVKIYHEKLNNWVEKEELKMYGKFMVAQYNSPWALPPFRHNEIMVRVNK